MEEAKLLLKIIKSFMEDKKCPENPNISEEKLYKLAKKHKVENFLKNWAETKCKNEEIRNKILSSYNIQIIKDTNENIELEQILNKFEEATIETLVVKGVTMKEVYPKDYMRKMCDLDILVHSKDFKIASNIIKALNFEKLHNEEKHLVFQKKPLIYVELHRKLMPDGDISSDYYNNIWSSSIKYRNYNNIYRMNIEDTYIFCIIHLLRHFKEAQIKIRDILDVYLINEKYKNIFNLKQLDKTLEKLEAKKFEENIKKISYKWFETSEINEFDEIEEFILQDISIKNEVNCDIEKNNGKINSIIQMFFPKFKRMKAEYPILKKLPILLPIIWIIRIFKKLFSKERTMKERVNKIKLIKNANKEEVKKIDNIYKKLGIIK